MTEPHQEEPPPSFGIRTPDQRLRVFISSTLQELAAERVAARRAVEQLRLTPVMFEEGARPYPPRALYRAYLAQSHVFLAIYWQSYGWVAPDETVSGLEDEYSLSAGLPRLVYVKTPSDGRQPRLDELISRIQTDDQTSYRRFVTVEELEGLVADDLVVLMTERFEANAAGASADGPARAPVSFSAPPTPATETVGRSREIHEVAQALVGGARLLTLVGPGGVGKSRLALEVCRDVQPEFPDGVAFVPLESVTEVSDVLRVLAERVGVAVEGGQSALQASIEALRDRQMLLLIDNFEQVVAAGPQVSALLEACPGLSVMVTSRRPLRLRAEREYPVSPLTLPPEVRPSLFTGSRTHESDDDTAPAVAMFVARTRDFAPDFALDDGNRRDVETLVRRLDGLPLAIELAAARMRLLEPRAILARLESGSDVLGHSGADIPARQRTLATTLEWSHGLLTASERALFARISVFPSGASLEAIEEVCSGAPVVDLLDDLASLIDSSLVHTGRSHDGPPWFTMLRTVQDFAEQQLRSGGEESEVQDRFVNWALARAATGDPSRSPVAHHNWESLQLDLGNLHAAVELLLDRGDCGRFVTLVDSMFAVAWQIGDAGRLTNWVERAHANGCGTPGAPHFARLVAMVSMSRFLVGDFAGALAVQDELDPEEVALTDPGCAALLYMTRAVASPFSDGSSQAREAAQRSAALADSVHFDLISAYSRSVLGSLALAAGDHDAAEAVGREALAISLKMGFEPLIAHQHGVLATAAIIRGDLAAGRRELLVAREALAAGPRALELAHLLGHAGTLAMAERRPEDAARAGAASDAILIRLGLARWPLFEEVRERVGAGVRAAVGDGYEALVAQAVEADPWQLFDSVMESTEPKES